MDAGHHNHQTSGNLTSSCGDFLTKEYTAIIQEAWRNLDVKMSNTLNVLTNKFLKNLQKHCKNGEYLSSKTGGVNFQLLT